jgi:hypothetical protein
MNITFRQIASMDILINILVCLLALLPGLFTYAKARNERKKSQELLSLVRAIGRIDSIIFRRRLNDPIGWSENEKMRRIIARQVGLYKRYSELVKDYSIQETEYFQTLSTFAFAQ